MQKNNQEFLQGIKDFCLKKKLVSESDEAMQAYQNVLDYINNYGKKEVKRC